MIEAVISQPLLLELALTDGVSSKFPRAKVYTDIGALVATIDLPHIASGLYQGTWTPSTTGQFNVHYTVFSDAGHTIADVTYERVADHVLVRALDQDLAFRKLLGHHGENTRDDVLTYDANNRPLTFRRRVFASKAAALASTAGGTGEGEILTVSGAATHFDAARWETLLRVLE